MFYSKECDACKNSADAFEYLADNWGKDYFTTANNQKFNMYTINTLEEVKNRVPFFNRRATALKVLARGELDKKLTFVADDYSMDAIKMILLVGGTVVRNKKQ